MLHENRKLGIICLGVHLRGNHCLDIRGNTRSGALQWLTCPMGYASSAKSHQLCVVHVTSVHPTARCLRSSRNKTRRLRQCVVPTRMEVIHPLISLVNVSLPWGDPNLLSLSLRGSNRCHRRRQGAPPSPLAMTNSLVVSCCFYW